MRIASIKPVLYTDNCAAAGAKTTKSLFFDDFTLFYEKSQEYFKNVMVKCTKIASLMANTDIVINLATSILLARALCMCSVISNNVLAMFQHLLKNDTRIICMNVSCVCTVNIGRQLKPSMKRTWAERSMNRRNESESSRLCRCPPSSCLPDKTNSHPDGWIKSGKLVSISQLNDNAFFRPASWQKIVIQLYGLHSWLTILPRLNVRFT